VVEFDPANQTYVCRDLFVRQFDGVGEGNRIVSRLEPTRREPSFLSNLRQHGLKLPEAMCG
jgi:hypothetical protein